MCAIRSATKKKMCGTKDHHLVNASREGGGRKRMVRSEEEKENWTAWRPQDDEQEEKFTRMVIQQGRQGVSEELGHDPGNMESAAEETAHNTHNTQSVHVPSTLCHSWAWVSRS